MFIIMALVGMTKRICSDSNRCHAKMKHEVIIDLLIKELLCCYRFVLFVRMNQEQHQDGSWKIMYIKLM